MYSFSLSSINDDKPSFTCGIIVCHFLLPKQRLQKAYFKFEYVCVCVSVFLPCLWNLCTLIILIINFLIFLQIPTLDSERDLCFSSKVTVECLAGKFEKDERMKPDFVIPFQSIRSVSVSLKISRNASGTKEQTISHFLRRIKQIDYRHNI